MPPPHGVTREGRELSQIRTLEGRLIIIVIGCLDVHDCVHGRSVRFVPLDRAVRPVLADRVLGKPGRLSRLAKQAQLAAVIGGSHLLEVLGQRTAALAERDFARVVQHEVVIRLLSLRLFTVGASRSPLAEVVAVEHSAVEDALSRQLLPSAGLPEHLRPILVVERHIEAFLDLIRINEIAALSIEVEIEAANLAAIHAPSAALLLHHRHGRGHSS